MRIVFFSDVYSPYVSGVVTAIRNFSRELIARGHEVTLFTSTPDPENKTIPVEGLNVIRLKPTSSLSKYPGFTTISMRSFRECAKRLNEIKPDIIHVHTPTLVGWFANYYAKRHKTPLVGTYHTFLRDVRDLVKGLNLLSESRTSRMADGYSRLHYNRNDIVIAPSQVILDELRKMGVKKPIYVVSNGVNIEQFKPSPTVQKNRYRFLHVGRLSPEKNVDIVLKAFQLVVLHEPKAELLIVGDGMEIDRLKALCEELGISPRVKFAGRIGNETLAVVYSECISFVTASTCETEGIVLLEAMACGLPVVGANKLAIPELVRHGESGLVFEPFNPEDCAQNMIRMLEDETLRKKCGESALACAQKYALSKSIDQLETIYQSLLMP